VIKEVEDDVKVMQEKLSINRGGSHGLSQFALDQEKGAREQYLTLSNSGDLK
jgi:hypothetical protein